MEGITREQEKQLADYVDLGYKIQRYNPGFLQILIDSIVDKEHAIRKALVCGKEELIKELMRELRLDRGNEAENIDEDIL